MEKKFDVTCVINGVEYNEGNIPNFKSEWNSPIISAIINVAIKRIENNGAFERKIAVNQ